MRSVIHAENEKREFVLRLCDDPNVECLRPYETDKFGYTHIHIFADGSALNNLGAHECWNKAEEIPELEEMRRICKKQKLARSML